MQDLKKSVLEGYDELLARLWNNPEFNFESYNNLVDYTKNIVVEIKKYLSNSIDKSFEAGKQQGLLDNNKKGESWRKGYQTGYAESNLKILELLSKYALKTKDIKTLNLIEEIQKEVINLK